MRIRQIIIAMLAVLLCSCSGHDDELPQTIRIISWGGIAADKADTLYSLARECGFDMHLGLYRAKESAVASMDAAARQGIEVIINFPQIKDSTETTVGQIKDHPALYAYHLKDEPDTSDFGWLESLCERIGEHDLEHPCYINLLPNWAWGADEYSDLIESFASRIDVPFYSFDNYPVFKENGEVKVRHDWYRNLEEFSQMARRHDKPFWGFVLAKAHNISDPWPDTTYPEPTLGHIRLQVFSNLLYGAQAIQYFNFTGIVDPVTCEKLPAFDIIRQVNSEIKAYSRVFAGCEVLGVWHSGDTIPCGTKRLEAMPHAKIWSIDVAEGGAVIALIENSGKTFLALQNRDCINPANIDVLFRSKVKLLTLEGEKRFDSESITLDPGEVVLFKM